MNDKRMKHGESLIEAGSFSAVELFRGLRSSQLRQIKEKSEVREYDAGHIFFRPEKKARPCFFWKRGVKRQTRAEISPTERSASLSCWDAAYRYKSNRRDAPAPSSSTIRPRQCCGSRKPLGRRSPCVEQYLHSSR